MQICEIIKLTAKVFLRKGKKKEVFRMSKKEKCSRKEVREHLAQFHLACELVKLIRHFFPDLLPRLRTLPDHRHQSYITYSARVMLMTRVLSSIILYQ